ncbi:hypothetical protein D3C84_1130040 [compost metagenome]
MVAISSPPAPPGKPGKFSISGVRSKAPPGISVAETKSPSSTSVENPSREAYRPAERPATPPPTTITSYRFIMVLTSTPLVSLRLGFF